ncbi:MAG: hypothetical protein ACJ8GW_03670 [Massilia sp.]
MVVLTHTERCFLERGGALWCMRLVQPEGWEIYKLTWEGEEVVEVKPPTQHQAEQWIFLLADLSGPSNLVAVHHAVSRPLGNPAHVFPPLL